jgi:hypothetical protein
MIIIKKKEVNIIEALFFLLCPASLQMGRSHHSTTSIQAHVKELFSVTPNVREQDMRISQTLQLLIIRSEKKL